MVRRKGDSHRRQLARVRYNARQRARQLTPMMTLANVAALSPYVPVPSRPGNFYGRILEDRVDTGRRLLTKYFKEWYNKKKDEQRHARQSKQLSSEESGDKANKESQVVSPNNLMGGKYTGNFRKPSKYKFNAHDYAMKYGYHATTENFGKVVDPNAVYLQHATWDTNLMAKTFAGAVLRKLFMKAGIPINDRTAVLPLLNVTVGTGFRIEYHEQHPTTNAISTIAYDTVAAETFTSIIETNWTAFRDAIIAILQNVNHRNPWSINLYSHDLNTAATQYRLLAQLDLSNVYVKWNSTSDMKLQNRTAADLAAAGDASVDRNDVQPLVGTIYQFRNDPKVKHIGTNDADLFKLQGVHNGGITLYRAAQFTLTGSLAYQNRPAKGLWTNCIKSANVILQPGEIKRAVVQQNCEGTLKNLFSKVRMESITGTSIYGVPCSAQLLVFEECLRSVGTNSLTVQYERKIRLGCVVSEVRKASPLKSSAEFGEINNP